MAGFKVSIGADSKRAERELSSFEKKTKSIAKSIAKGFKERIGHKLFDGLAGAAGRIPGMLGEAIDSASSLNEQISKSETVFGSSSKEIQSWAKGAAKAMGMSEVAALEASGTVGTLFQAMGMESQKAADMSRSMVELAADLGSFNNTSTEDAIQAIGAALRGESEPIRRYGVLLDDATLKAEALEKGLYDGKGALEPASRAMAAYSVILKQTKAAQGDFAKTSDGLANSKKILNAQFENASTTVGQALLPAMQKLVNFMNEADIEGFAKGVGTIATAFVDLASEIKNAYDFYRKFFSEGYEAAIKDKYTAPIADSFKSFEDDIKRYEALEKLGMLDSQGKRELEEHRERQRVMEARRKAKAQATPKIEESEEPGRVSAAPAILKEPEPIEAKMREKGPDEVLLDGLRDAVRKKEDDLFNMSSRSSNLAVSSMQRIGGGGGVYGELDLSRRQTKLQEQMVSLLEKLNGNQGRGPVSDF